MSVWICGTDNRPPSLGRVRCCRGSAHPSLLDRHNARGTFFIPGHTALAYPDLVRRIAAGGHEIAHHGWVHENPASFDEAGERNVLERGLDALDRVAGVRPEWATARRRGI